MLDHLYSGDCRAVLPTLPDECVDLVFADPPYNLQLRGDLWRPNLTQVDGVDDDWDQFDSFASYDQFTREWLLAVQRVMKPTATLWVSGTYHNIFRVGQMMQDLGFWILNTITWFKRNAMPNFKGTRLKNDTEFVIWAKRDNSSTYTFNYQLMKRFNDGKQLGSVWDIPVCGGVERLRDADGRKLHSTQKPEALLERIILASSNPKDLVLDPFVGTGTTAAVAKRLRRHWLGIERNPYYLRAAQARVLAIEPLPADHQLVKPRPRRRRVPFLLLLQHGYLSPGQQLYLSKSTHSAIIEPDGKISANGVVGSIHQVASHLKGVQSCNGWDHWFYIDAETGERTVLDALRERVRREHFGGEDT